MADVSSEVKKPLIPWYHMINYFWTDFMASEDMKIYLKGRTRRDEKLKLRNNKKPLAEFFESNLILVLETVFGL